MSTKVSHTTRIIGSVKPGFEPVRVAFIENFTHRREVGAACCIYYQGEKVFDLWGGVRDKATGEPWTADTMVLVFSATKGMSALAMALAESRGLFDYDEPHQLSAVATQVIGRYTLGARARVSSGPTCTATASTAPETNETIRHVATGRPWWASARARSAYK